MDGYQVDLAAMTGAANAAADIARATEPLATQFATARDDVAGGAPGSRSAAAAGQLPADTLGNHTTQIRGIADKLKQTAEEYQRQDAAAAQSLNKIMPAGPADHAPAGRIGSVLDGGL